MKVEEIRNIGVIGAGIMGHGIAQIFAIKGYKVKLFDNDSGVLKSEIKGQGKKEKNQHVDLNYRGKRPHWRFPHADDR